MKSKSIIKVATLSALLIPVPMSAYASLIYQIDSQQSFDTDSTLISGFIEWDESLSIITNWHFETNSGFGVHNISTDGAIFDSGGSNDTILGGEALQTFYTVTPNSSQELEIIWDTSPANASSVNNWSIKETWVLNTYPGVHWRTGSVSVSLVSAVPIPASIWLFSTGLLGLAGLSKRKSNRR